MSAGLFQSSPGLDTVDSGKTAQGSHDESIFKSLHGKETVLTLDGGGIRGLILIQLLLALEEFTKQPIVKLFDWIGGTSTGGILALAVAHGELHIRERKQPRRRRLHEPHKFVYLTMKNSCARFVCAFFSIRAPRAFFWYFDIFV